MAGAVRTRSIADVMVFLCVGMTILARCWPLPNPDLDQCMGLKKDVAAPRPCLCASCCHQAGGWSRIVSVSPSPPMGFGRSSRLHPTLNRLSAGLLRPIEQACCAPLSRLRHNTEPVTTVPCSYCTTSVQAGTNECCLSRAKGEPPRLLLSVKSPAREASLKSSSLGSGQVT